MFEVDKDWFQAKIRDRGTSQRQVAFKLGMDPAAFSLILSGRRRLEVREAAALAVLIGQPLNDVLIRAGVPLRSQTLAVIGHADKDGRVDMRRAGRAPALGLGAEHEAITSDYYGFTYYVGPEMDCTGRMCLAEVKPNEFRILWPDAAARFTKLLSARPIVLIRP